MGAPQAQVAMAEAGADMVDAGADMEMLAAPALRGCAHVSAPQP
jgi:hypothetical protein